MAKQIPPLSAAEVLSVLHDMDAVEQLALDSSSPQDFFGMRAVHQRNRMALAQAMDALRERDAYRAALEAVVDDADTFGWQSSTIQRACALLGTE